MKKDNVNFPSHYTKSEIECIDAIKSALGEGYEYYLQGNIIKYIWRYRDKMEWRIQKKQNGIWKK